MVALLVFVASTSLNRSCCHGSFSLSPLGGDESLVISNELPEDDPHAVGPGPRAVAPAFFLPAGQIQR